MFSPQLLGRAGCSSEQARLPGFCPLPTLSLAGASPGVCEPELRTSQTWLWPRKKAKGADLRAGGYDSQVAGGGGTSGRPVRPKGSGKWAQQDRQQERS